MKKLSTQLEQFFKELDIDAKDMIDSAKRKRAYKNAVRKIWKDEQASDLIFAHTNAFYIRKDDRPKKGEFRDKPYILCDICIDDPTIRSEIDSRRSILEIALKDEGLSFNELRIIPARRGMRKRHPFIDEHSNDR